jgi:hypothetical protein
MGGNILFLVLYLQDHTFITVIKILKSGIQDQHRALAGIVRASHVPQLPVRRRLAPAARQAYASSRPVAGWQLADPQRIRGWVSNRFGAPRHFLHCTWYFQIAARLVQVSSYPPGKEHASCPPLEVVTDAFWLAMRKFSTYL